VPGRAAVAPGSATPELDSTHMNGLIDDKKRSVVPTVQSKVLFTTVSCTKMVETIEVPFGVWTRVRPRNHCFYVRPGSLRGRGNIWRGISQYGE